MASAAAKWWPGGTRDRQRLLGRRSGPSRRRPCAPRRIRRRNRVRHRAGTRRAAGGGGPDQVDCTKAWAWRPPFPEGYRIDVRIVANPAGSLKIASMGGRGLGLPKSAGRPRFRILSSLEVRRGMRPVCARGGRPRRSCSSSWVPGRAGLRRSPRRRPLGSRLRVGASHGGGSVSNLRRALGKASSPGVGGAAPRLEPDELDAAHFGGLCRGRGGAAGRGGGRSLRSSLGEDLELWSAHMAGLRLRKFRPVEIASL